MTQSVPRDDINCTKVISVYTNEIYFALAVSCPDASVTRARARTGSRLPSEHLPHRTLEPEEHQHAMVFPTGFWVARRLFHPQLRAI